MSKIEVKQDKGKPCLFIDGIKTPPILYGLSDIPASNSNTAQAQRNIKNFSERGINLVNVDTGIHLGWHKTSDYDPSAVIAEIGEVLSVNPKAKVLVRLHMNPPYWWLRDNSQECVIYRTKNGDIEGIDDGESDRLIRDDTLKRMRVSLASTKWIREASAILAKLCNALKDTPEGDALLGFQVACGIFGEWHGWGVDVSKPYKERFYKFIKEKYNTNENLQSAYNDAEVTFETARFSPEVTPEGDNGHFRDPRFSRIIMDSQECMQTAVAEAILTFCAVIKEHLPNILTGAFYGYHLGVGGTMMPIEGHLKPHTLYQNRKLIDFLCGPFAYLDNRLPDEVPMQRGLLESCRLNGILWLTEMDQFPTCVPLLGGDENLKEQTISVLRRNILQPLLKGHGAWYYDHRVQPRYVMGKPELEYLSSIYRKLGWWEENYLLDEIEKLQNIAKSFTNAEYTSQADVLLVYDTDSYFCRARVNDKSYQIHKEVAKCGVVYDCIYLNDIEKAEINRYKCIIFVNCYMIKKEKREQLKALTKGITSIWLYASGFCDNYSLSTDNISDAVGMNIETVNAPLSFNTVNGNTEEIESNALSPYFAVNDKEATALAFYDNNAVAAAQKGNNVWVGMNYLPYDIIKTIIEKSGAHIYLNTGDTVLAGGNIIVINCTHGGNFDLLLKNGKVINITLEKYTTAVFDANTGERII